MHASFRNGACVRLDCIKIFRFSLFAMVPDSAAVICAWTVLRYAPADHEGIHCVGVEDFCLGGNCVD